MPNSDLERKIPDLNPTHTDVSIPETGYESPLAWASMVLYHSSY